MKKRVLTIKALLLLCVFSCLTGKAQSLPDSVIMTVAGKPIPVSEFIYIAQKNGEADFSNSKSIHDYTELFKNFKLKVADAETKGMDKTPDFEKELEGYHAQLVAGFLSDKAGEEKAAREVYDRGENLLDLSYVLFLFPPGQTLTKDSLPLYEQARTFYDRLEKGEDIDVAGKELALAGEGKIVYEHVPALQPMRAYRTLEKIFFEMPVGGITTPILTTRGYYVAKLNGRKPNPGLVCTAHILIGFPKDSAEVSREETLALANEVLRKVKAGEDFAELAGTYSTDPGSAVKGGELPPFGPGVMVAPFEEAAFALRTPGEISGLVETQFGYHIIKLLERRPRPSFDTEKRALMRTMGQGERNFDLYKDFDDRMRKEYNYQFYPEAWQELVTLSDQYFPSDRAFFDVAKDMQKTLFKLETEEFTQGDFAHYMISQPFSTKTYALEFMQEIYDLFIRELTTNAERKTLQQKHPEFAYLMQEYRDGILLFEVSSQEVWCKPVEEQEMTEAKWIESLNRKYPVVINKKALKRLQK